MGCLTDDLSQGSVDLVEVLEGTLGVRLDGGGIGGPVSRANLGGRGGGVTTGNRAWEWQKSCKMDRIG